MSDVMTAGFDTGLVEIEKMKQPDVGGVDAALVDRLVEQARAPGDTCRATGGGGGRFVAVGSIVRH